jgi:hypothetical protein
MTFIQNYFIIPRLSVIVESSSNNLKCRKCLTIHCSFSKLWYFISICWHLLLFLGLRQIYFLSVQVTSEKSVISSAKPAAPDKHRARVVSSVPELKIKAAAGSAPAPSSHSSNSAPDLLRGGGNSSEEAFKKPNLKEFPYSMLLPNMFKTETGFGKNSVLWK